MEEYIFADDEETVMSPTKKVHFEVPPPPSPPPPPPTPTATPPPVVEPSPSTSLQPETADKAPTKMEEDEEEDEEEEEEDEETPAVAANKLTMQELVGLLDATVAFLESPTTDALTLLTQTRDVRARCDSVLIVKRREAIKKRRCNHYVHVYMGLYNGAYIFRFDKNIYSNPPPVREQLLNRMNCRTKLIFTINTGPKESKKSNSLVKKLQQVDLLYTFGHLPRKYKCVNNNAVADALRMFNDICNKNKDYTILKRDEDLIKRIIKKFKESQSRAK
ncbi:hypothetical protein [Epinotia aporema granulovirus]|uniref:Uncharacterized protein n=1 Tax=Epinotia aporema granulovirus TaxID=166056 RepID=K4EQS4_9BBAC|nr:hypothetical protein [Epinotia aporema granulovirus]AER41441.1 hypothetical protein [Epinotia aporema granulovirus]